MNNSDFQSKLSKVKVLSMQTNVVYSIFIGDFSEDEAINKVSDALLEAFPGNTSSVKLGDGGIVQISVSFDSEQFKDTSDQIVEKIKSAIMSSNTN
jgi:hypothetical protein